MRTPQLLSGGTTDGLITANPNTQQRNKGGTTTILLLSLLAVTIVVSVFNLVIGHHMAFKTTNNNNASSNHSDKQLNDIMDMPHQDDTTTSSLGTKLTSLHRISIRRNGAASLPHQRDDTDNIIYTGEEITKYLTGEQPFPTTASCPKQLNGQCRLKFIPGTITQYTSSQTLQQCYVDAKKYKEHTHRSQNTIVASISHDHKMIYRNIPKSASSTSRHAMQDYLHGQDKSIKHDDLMDLVHNQNYTMISFIREPLNRFYSSYDEAFFRMGPWMEKGEIVWDKPQMRKWYQNVKHKIDPYPYLYEGFTEITDFRKMYCPKEVLDTGKFLKCNEYDSIDDGTLLGRFERFVSDYDGIEPFDVHLNMQTTNLIYGNTGEPLPITSLYNASDAERGWQEVASAVGVTIPNDEMTHGRHQSRRFNVKKVSEATQRKICSILALDYCCLNFKLPKVCEGVVYCSLEQMDLIWRDEAKGKNLIIRPWEQ